MRHYLPRVIFIFALALLPGRMLAQPLILANPVNRSFYTGGSNPTFQVLATGTPTFQWQVEVPPATSFTNILSNDPAYTATTAAGFSPGLTVGTLTVNSPGSVTNGTAYQVIVTGAGGSVTSFPAALGVYTQTVTPTVTITTGTTDGSGNPTIAADSIGNITIQITGLAPGDKVRIRRFIDANDNGSVDPGETLVQSFAVQDGVVNSVGGVPDPDLLSDQDNTAGSITTHFNLPTSSEGGRLVGTYLVRVSSSSNNNDFATITKKLIVTQTADAQSISGQVVLTGTSTPVPYAGIIVLQSNGHDQKYVAGAIADASGDYTVNAPPGTYMVLAVGSIFVTPFSGGQQVTLSSSINQTGVDLSVEQPTSTITGPVTDSAGGGNIQGVQYFIQSNNGNAVTLAASDSNGVIVAPAVAESDWDLSPSQYNLHAQGYLQPQNDAFADTTSGSISYTASNTPLKYIRGTALIHGTLENGSGTGLSGIQMEDSDQDFQDQGNTYPDGSYFLLATVDPAVGSPDNWNVGVSSNSSGLVSYIAPPNQNVNVATGTDAYLANFVAITADSHFQGTVMNGSTPVSGVEVDALLQNNNNSNVQIQTMTLSDGTFDLGVYGGTWNISVDSNSADQGNPNFVSGLLTETILDNATTSNLILGVVNSTGTISGTVEDYNGQPLSNYSVGAGTSISGVNYVAGAQTGGDGSFSIPVIAGTWNVSADGNFMFNPISVPVLSSVSGVIFKPTVFNQEPQNQTVTAGTSTGINVNTNAPSFPTLQWQVSTDNGAQWSNLTESAPYSGTTTLTLNINPTTVAMNGYQYRCVAGYIYNNQNDSENSFAMTLTVNAPSQQQPSYTGQAGNQNQILGNGLVNFSVSTTGNPAPTIQWQVSTDGGNTWNNVSNGGPYSGATTPVLTVNSTDTTLSGDQYRAVASNGVGSPQNSNPATLVVATSSVELTWLQNNFSPTQLGNPAISGPLADPAHDGVPNLIKYAFNIGSFVNGPSMLPHSTVAGGQISLSFLAQQPDLTYTVQASTDLVNWTTTGVNTQINNQQVTASYSIPGPGRAFLRIVVQPLP